MKVMFFIILLTSAATVSVVNGEKCGPVPGPFVLTTDTVVINLNCNESTRSPHHAIIPELHKNVTHLAVQLLHCHTVPVGLFTSVPDNLTSVTVASEDAVQLLEGTFNGLEHVSEFRLLGFSSLINLSRSVFEPLRNIETLVLGRFGQKSIKLSAIAQSVQHLSGSPIKELVITNIRSTVEQLNDRILNMRDFAIHNVSVKTLIVTGFQLSYAYSIRRAFPDLVSLCVDQDNRYIPETRLAMLDLVFLSNTIVNFTVYLSKDRESQPVLQNVSSHDQLNTILRASGSYFLELASYFSTIAKSEDCFCGIIFKLGANLSRVTMHETPVIQNVMRKPLCFDENNKLEYLDFTGSPMPQHFQGATGLLLLKYMSLENTGIESLPHNFTAYFPSLQVLKLGKLGIKKIIETADENFFGLSPNLREVYLENCKLTSIPSVIFSRLFHLQRIDLSNNFLQTFNVDLYNSAELSFVNLSRNYMRNIPQELISELNKLARNRSNVDPLLIDLSLNRLSCQCNSLYFIKWLKLSDARNNIKFQAFENYHCSYPNGSLVYLPYISVSQLERQCSIMDKFINASSNCPCDDDTQRQLRDIRMSLKGHFCKKDNGDLFEMNNLVFPGCFEFDPFTSPTFVVPVVVGGILLLIVIITIGLLYYYRQREPVRQIRECLEMYPGQFIGAALQYVMSHNHAEVDAEFDLDIIVFAQDEDRSAVHNHFIGALLGRRRVITADDFRPGVPLVEAVDESIRRCRWIIPVITSNFLSDQQCTDFVSRAQFSRPHALIPIIWEEALALTDASVAGLLALGDPLYWPGDLAADDDKRKFWTSLLERTA